MKTLYYSLIHSHLSYGTLIWGSAFQYRLRQLEVIQKKAVRNICNAVYNAHTDPLFKQLNQVGTLTQILVKRSFYLNPSILPEFGCLFDYLNLGNSQLITTIRVMWRFILSWPNIILTWHTVKVYSFPSNGITRIWVILGGTKLWQ